MSAHSNVLAEMWRRIGVLQADRPFMSQTRAIMHVCDADPPFAALWREARRALPDPGRDGSPNHAWQKTAREEPA
ncbi:MAG: hypothetical protein AB7G10_24735 [Reyranellaceae bacterium]